jgi:hypothetical protein
VVVVIVVVVAVIVSIETITFERQDNHTRDVHDQAAAPCPPFEEEEEDDIYRALWGDASSPCRYILFSNIRSFIDCPRCFLSRRWVFCLPRKHFLRGMPPLRSRTIPVAMVQVALVGVYIIIILIILIVEVLEVHGR